MSEWHLRSPWLRDSHRCATSGDRAGRDESIARPSERFDESRGSSVDWVVPHQANARILEAVGLRVGWDPARAVCTLEHHVNTSEALIPLALDTAVRDGRMSEGDLVLFEAMGGGATWGAKVLRW